MAKHKNMDEQINKDADIELKDDLVKQYQECKQEVDKRNGLLPNIFDKEEYRKAIDNEDNMLYLAKAISNREKLYADLSSDIKNSIQEHSKKYDLHQQNELFFSYRPCL